MADVIVGADVGGTKTAVAVAVGDEIVARAQGPGAPMRPGRAMASATTIAEVVRQGLAGAGRLRADTLVVGAAGAGRAAEQEELRAALKAEDLAARIVVTTDIELALAGAFGSGPGIVVSAGTGSVALGRNARGTLRRIGGYGWQMGDEGSGYAIGRAALGAVGRASDGRSPATALHERLLDATRCLDLDELIRWASVANAAQVASLAPPVLEVAGRGDRVAQGIADYAARELSQLAVCLLPQLDPGDAPMPVAVTGGLLGADRPLRRAVLAKLAEEPTLKVVEAPIDAAAGAVILGR